MPADAGSREKVALKSRGSLTVVNPWFAHAVSSDWIRLDAEPSKADVSSIVLINCSLSLGWPSDWLIVAVSAESSNDDRADDHGHWPDEFKRGAFAEFGVVGSNGLLIGVIT